MSTKPLQDAPLQHEIQHKLVCLNPTHLEVINESHGHSVAPGSETHFKVVVVSSSFAGQSLVDRHRLMYSLLADALNGGVHALALHTFTPEEWEKKQQADKSPICHSKS